MLKVENENAPLAFDLESLEKNLITSIEEERLKLPVLPDVAANVLAQRFDEDADTHQLSKLIHRDPAMAGHVLRMANSAAYNVGTPIVSLQQAVIRLGLSCLREIVISVAVRGQLFSAKQFEPEMRAIWKHSAATGAYAKEIARKCRMNVENAFLCGLLHDIGKPIALLGLQQTAPELAHTQAVEASKHLHSRLGETLALHWKLPASVLGAIKDHHNAGAIAEDDSPVAITVLANLLAHLTMENPPTADEESEIAFEDHEEKFSDLPACHTLNLYPEDVEELFEKQKAVKTFVEAMT